jgi:hypothetical protein
MHATVQKSWVFQFSVNDSCGRWQKDSIAPENHFKISINCTRAAAGDRMEELFTLLSNSFLKDLPC